MHKHEGPLAATLDLDDDLAERILDAFSNPAAQDGKPYISGDKSDLRSVTFDGKFDLIVVARILRESLRAALITWIDKKDQS